MPRITLNDIEINQIIVFYERSLKEILTYESSLRTSLGNLRRQIAEEESGTKKSISPLVVPIINQEVITVKDKPTKRKIEKIENYLASKTNKRKSKKKQPPKGMIILPYMGKSKRISFDEFGMPFYQKTD